MAMRVDDEPSRSSLYVRHRPIVRCRPRRIGLLVRYRTHATSTRTHTQHLLPLLAAHRDSTVRYRYVGTTYHEQERVPVRHSTGSAR